MKRIYMANGGNGEQRPKPKKTTPTTKPKGK